MIDITKYNFNLTKKELEILVNTHPTEDELNELTLWLDEGNSFLRCNFEEHPANKNMNFIEYLREMEYRKREYIFHNYWGLINPDYYELIAKKIHELSDDEFKDMIKVLDKLQEAMPELDEEIDLPF